MSVSAYKVDEEHLTTFAKFVQYELATGGPDAHMRYLGWISQEFPLDERVWLAGVYLSCYNAATAEFIWTHWPWERMQRHAEDFEMWVRECWPGFFIKRERRAIRTPQKFLRYLSDYFSFARTIQQQYASIKSSSAEVAYEHMWARVLHVYGCGRYAAYKILEFLHRYGEAPFHTVDLRPEGGWSPRSALTLLYPAERNRILPYDDRIEATTVTTVIQNDLLATLTTRYYLPLDPFLLEVFLCNYRQFLEADWLYPGRSHDTELGHIYALQQYFGSKYQTRLFAARTALIPPACRGEDQTWAGERKELGKLYRNKDVVWSDILYKYEESKIGSSVPLHKNHMEEDTLNLARQTLFSPIDRRVFPYEMRD